MVFKIKKHKIIKPKKHYCKINKPKRAYALANNGCKIRHGVSLLETRTLDKLGVKERSKVIILFGKTYVVDGYDSSTNTIFEICGSFWHGDPRVYDLKKMNIMCKKTFGQLNYETRLKYQIWKDCGFKVLYAWEKDLNEGKLLFHEFKGINYPL